MNPSNFSVYAGTYLGVQVWIGNLENPYVAPPLVVPMALAPVKLSALDRSDLQAVSPSSPHADVAYHQLVEFWKIFEHFLCVHYI